MASPRRAESTPFATSEIARAALRHDFFRRSPFAWGGRGEHKEWHHFCILGAGVDLLVNFSASDDVRDGAARGAELPRVTVLVRTTEWDGDVDTFAAAQTHIQGGRIHAALGSNRLEFRDGEYHLSVALQDRPVCGELVLRPETTPCLAPNIPLPEGPPLHWVIVPRLRGRGTLRVGTRDYDLDDVLAYHDHNFGHFRWGHAFSWIWGFCLPTSAANPWSLAFVRLSNRLRTRALAQGMFLWRGAGLGRVFRDRDIELRMSREYLEVPRVFKIPRVMHLLAPDQRADVPRWVEMEARADGDVLCLRFDAEHLAQVVLPSETDLSVTIINEVTGKATLHGRVAGEPVAVEGRGVCEFLGA
jgi:hypothetical protein